MVSGECGIRFIILFIPLLLKKQPTRGHLAPSLCPLLPASARPPEQVGWVIRTMERRTAISWGPAFWKVALLIYPHKSQQQGGLEGISNPLRHIGGMRQNWTPNPDPSDGKRWPSHLVASRYWEQAAQDVTGGHQAPTQGHRSQPYLGDGHSNTPICRACRTFRVICSPVRLDTSFQTASFVRLP